MRIWTQQDEDRAVLLARIAAHLVYEEIDIPEAVKQAHQILEEARKFQANLPGREDRPEG
jgi:hypothetical protein